MDVAAPSDSYSPTIKPINKGVVHRICSGQVILDLSSAVKELVENSLDAGATCIEVALKEYGKDCFQVIDNGSGISPNNFKVLALKHHTSKLADFPDLQSLTTFGFRGEALSSLCVLGNLTVETRTKNESVATHLSYDRSGLLVAEKKTARQIGTTVSVTNLFSSLPVRSKEFTRNIRKEYGKLISLLNAYALIAKGVRLVCTNTAGRSVRSVVLKTQGSGSLKDNIVTLFGMSTFNCLEAVTLCISDSCKVDGFMSKPGQGNGRNMGDRQFFFVNGRPVDMPKVTKLVNEIYRSANSQQHPVAILNFTVPSRACDVNVTPDKRKVFFSDESSILHVLREGLQHIYSSSNARYSVNKAEELTKEADGSDLGSPRQKSHMLLKPLSQNWSFRKEVRDDDQMLEDHIPEKTVEADAKDIHDVERMTSDNTIRRDFTLRVHSFKQVEDSRKLTTHGDSITSVQSTLSSSKRIENGTATSRDSRSHSSIVQSSLENFITVNKRKHENVTTLLSEVPILRNRTLHLQSKNNNSENNAAVSRSPSPHRVDDSAEADDNRPSKYFGAEEISNNIVNAHSSGGNTCEGEPQVDFKTMSEGVLVEVPSDSSDILLDARKPSSGLKICSNLQFSIQELKLRRQQRLSQLQSSNSICQRTKTERCYAAATLELSQPENEERKAKALAAATTELEKLFRKEDFGRMKVIGQFNLGFIIGKLDHDLFIVDQHAADEKYNFERLSESTILNIQPLLRPIRLELSPEEEVVASMHIDIIRKNGFALEEDPDAPPGHHFKLKAIPFSKNITFGVEDVKELISTLADGHGECTVIGSYKMDTPDSVCPSRVRGMLASRACRSSVMIGDALGRNEMNRILGHLAKLKSPWNCPHGRPTMRHLVDLTTIYNNNTSQQ